METFKEKLIEIIGFGMERERAECKAEDILSLFSYPRVKELIKAQQELIDFYGKNISDNAVFLQMHHMGASLEEYNKGKELRNRIEVLRKEVGYDK